MEGASGALCPPELLPRMLDFGRWELIGGRLRERPTSVESSVVSARLLAALVAHVHPARLGSVHSGKLALRFFPDDSQVRLSNAVFVAAGRIRDDEWGDDFLRIPPELAIECVPAGEDVESIRHKAHEYLRAGVQLIWVVYPATRSVTVIRPDGNESRLTSTDVLSGEDVVPGFEVPVADLFDF